MSPLCLKIGVLSHLVGIPSGTPLESMKKIFNINRWLLNSKKQHIKVQLWLSWKIQICFLHFKQIDLPAVHQRCREPSHLGVGTHHLLCRPSQRETQCIHLPSSFAQILLSQHGQSETFFEIAHLEHSFLLAHLYFSHSICCLPHTI